MADVQRLTQNIYCEAIIELERTRVEQLADTR